MLKWIYGVCIAGLIYTFCYVNLNPRQKFYRSGEDSIQYYSVTGFPYVWKEETGIEITRVNKWSLLGDVLVGLSGLCLSLWLIKKMDELR